MEVVDGVGDNAVITAPQSISRRRFVEQLSIGAVATLMFSGSNDATAARRAASSGTHEDQQPESSTARSAEAPRRLGVALVGLGSYSTGELAPALRLTRHCRLAAVVTGLPGKGREWANRHGFPRQNVYGYEAMHKMAGNPDIDIVYVVTPNALHAEHAIAAARAGKHVICEKPMAVSVAECDAMIAACREAGVRLSIGYRLHFDPYHREMMRLAHERDFGAFRRMKGAFAFTMSRRVWRTEKRLAGGGPLMDLGIYVIQAACMAVGGPAGGGGPLTAPVAVTAREGRKTRPDLFVDVEQSIEWTMEFADGARAEGMTSYQDSANEFRADADDGWISLRPAFSYRGIGGRTPHGALRFDPPVNQQARQMDDFAQCVREGRESRVAGEMGRRDLAIIEAIYEAARTGRRVPVPT